MIFLTKNIEILHANTKFSRFQGVYIAHVRGSAELKQKGARIERALESSRAVIKVTVHRPYQVKKSLLFMKRFRSEMASRDGEARSAVL